MTLLHWSIAFWMAIASLVTPSATAPKSRTLHVPSAASFESRALVSTEASLASGSALGSTEVAGASTVSASLPIGDAVEDDPPQPQMATAATSGQRGSI